MQTPEKLSLIGGSILLSSGLIFGLKSNSASILPSVGHSIGNFLQGKNNQELRQQDFNSNYQQAQKKGWQVGRWGTAQFYVDDQGTMHVGQGQLTGSFSNLVDTTKVNAISFDASAQAPNDSDSLLSNNNNLSDNYTLTHINNMNNLDTSHVNNMNGIFGGDRKLSSLDGIKDWDTHNVNNMYDMFYNDYSLSNLDISNFNTSNVNNMNNMFINDTIKTLKLGSNTKLQNNTALSGYYQSNGQTLNLDGNAHPGTWRSTWPQDQFNQQYQQAQQNHWQTGNWGNAKFYIDNQGTMNVGSGQLQGSYSNVASVTQVRTINLEGPVQAPQDSSYLFSAPNGTVGDNINSLNAINNLSQLDTSQATNMSNMFYDNTNLTNLDVSHFNTSHVTDMDEMFNTLSNLQSIDTGNFDTSHVTDMFLMFANDDFNFYLANYDTSNVRDTRAMLSSNGTNQLTLGPRTRFSDSTFIESGNWKNGNQTLSTNQLGDGNYHPGTWVRQ